MHGSSHASHVLQEDKEAPENMQKATTLAGQYCMQSHPANSHQQQQVQVGMGGIGGDAKQALAKNVRRLSVKS